MNSRVRWGRACVALGVLGIATPSSLAAQTIEVVQRLSKPAITAGATVQVTGTPNTAASRRAKVRLVYRADDRRDVFANNWSMKVRYTINLGTGTPITDSLTIWHDQTTDVYEALQLHDLTQANASLTIGAVTLTNATNVPTNVDIELIVESTPVYAFSPTTKPTLTVGGARVSWNAVTGAREYELEWVFVDSAAGPGPSDPFLRKMATRVLTESLFVQLDSVYPAGTVSYRVRGVGRHVVGGALTTARRPGAWSNRIDYSTKSQKNFERLKTWQYAAAFGEHGRRSATLTYFDGLSRKRQVLTPSQADTVTLVGETKYDFEGRPTLEILPAPRAGTTLNYATLFSTTTAGLAFTAEHFNDGAVDSLGTGAGAGRYYSTNNNVPGIHSSYVPDAEGYPYRVTEYTHDNTGRVRRSSGVGAALRLGAGHDEQFQYGTASTTELRRLFGSNAGTGSHYQRNLRRDPNGQATVAYVDDRQHVIATALAGEPPSALIALASSHPDSFSIDISDNNTIDPATQARQSTTRIVNTEPATYEFSYSVTGVDYQATLGGGTYCPSCVYEVTLQIANAQGRPVMLYTSAVDSSAVLVREIRDPGPPACTAATTATAYGPQVVRFTARLDDLGEYTVTKTLRLTAGALDVVATTATDRNTRLVSGPYRAVTRSEIDSTSCATTCEEHCEAATSTTTELNACLEACSGFINASIATLKEEECRVLNAQLLADVSPGGYLWEDDRWLAHAANLQNGRQLYEYRRHWRSSQALLLVKKHPEACHARDCSVLIPSEIYDAQMAVVGSYDSALALGYLNPLRLNTGQPNGPLSGFSKPDPYFVSVGGQPAFGASLRNRMRDTLQVFVRNADSTPYQSLWEFVSDPVNYFDDDCPANPADCNPAASSYAGELPPPDDYKWRVFRSVYLGLKKQFHVEFTEIPQTPQYCPYWDDPNAHFKRPPTFDSLADAQAMANGALVGFCADLCPLRAADWVQSLKASCTTLSAATEATVDSLLAVYCQGSCGLENPWALLTKEALASGNPILTQVQSLIQPCSLDSIAVDSPYETKRSCNMTCDTKKEGEAPHECVGELIDLLNRYLPAMGDKIVELAVDRTRFALCIADSLDFVRFRSAAIGFGVNSNASNCTISFYDSTGTLVANNRIAHIEASSYAKDPPPNIPTAVLAQYTHVSVTAKMTDGKKRTLFLFSTCAFPTTALPLECTVAKRPVACTAEVFKLVDAYAHRNDPKPVPPDSLTCFTGPATRLGQTLQLPRGWPFGPDRRRPRGGSRSCTVIIARDNGAKIDPLLLTDFSYPQPVGSIPPSLPQTIDGKPFSGIGARVTLTDGSNVVVYLFSDCGLAFEDDCQTVPADVDLPEAPPMPPDQCLTDLQEEADIIAQERLNRDREQHEEDTREHHVNECFGRFFHEVFTYSRRAVEHHYALSYYDQAGNLVQTVPPEGVNVLTPTQVSAGAEPQHRLASSYKYNSRNQMILQYTPDGDTMRLWYNDVGQLRLTQDPDQRNSGTYSFSRYDRQGRITATGVVAGAAVGPNSTREPEFPSATNSALTETIRTVYDVPQPSSCAAVAQEHLRGRVSALIVEPIEGVTSVSSCYSYDQHGNVRTFVQNIAGLGPKRLDYEYDLATGNVGELRYQQGATDQTLFRFDYDAGNRLTAAYSSMDGELWDRDARIQYYRHGPMARMELGQTVIQGIDYVYTLQGWLKGVNANTLQTSRDPGRDGDTTVVGNPRRSVPADAFGFSLSYHPGDYKSTGASAVQFEAQTGGSGLEAAGPGLFDGNIAHSVSANDASLASGASPLGVAYRHDQINRLDSARVFSNTNTIANSWSPSGRSDDFLMAVRYDANGNIAGVVRNAGAGTATQIDSLTYHYSGSNRLSHIDDSVAATTNSSDLGDQRPLNYDYSRRGEVKADSAAGLRIQWTMNGQVSEIEKADGSHLEFRYDGNRQRIEKILKPSTSPSTWQYRYYVRDPHGNPLATYLQRQLSDGGSVTTETTLEDIVISAENRIGILRRDLVLHTGVSPNPGPFIRRTGARRYELVDNLGSVRVLIADRRKGLDANADGQVDTYGTLRLATFDYYPFGLSVPGRFDDTLSYRYGFDGAERDDEIAGQGRVYDFGARMYDASVGRFLSIDPLGKDHPEYSPYLFAGNKPIWATDAFGMEECTGTSCDPVSTVASGPDAGAADKRDWVNTAPPGFVEGKDYTPAEVAQVFKGAPYDPDYPHPVGFKAKNYARSSGCLMSGYLVCSPYVNAAATLWLTGRLETDELANGNLPPSSAYFQRGLSGQALVEGLINKGATENVRELLLNAPARFEKNFRELDIDHSNFVVLIKRPMLAADPTHVAFAYWQPGSGRSGGQWMVSEANQRAGEVINHSLHDFSRHLAKTNVIEVRALSK